MSKCAIVQPQIFASVYTMTWICTKTNHFKPLVILLLTVGFCHSIRLRLIYMAIKTIKAKFRNISHHIDSIWLRGAFIHICHYSPSPFPHNPNAMSVYVCVWFCCEIQIYESMWSSFGCLWFQSKWLDHTKEAT